MDPDANLEEQRRLAARLMERIERPSPMTDRARESDWDDVLRLTELVIALDNWIAGGGFLPRAWQKGG